MRARILRFLPGLLAGVMLAGAAYPCGDKLVGLGGGVPFARIHPQHYVGQIVLYTRPDSGLRSVNDRIRLGQRLQRDGHTVRLVDNPQDLDIILRGTAADLVLADQKDAASIKARLNDDPNAPMLLSLVGVPAAAELQGAGAGPGCEFQVQLEQSKAVAAALQSLMTRRQSGAVPGCASNRRS